MTVLWTFIGVAALFVVVAELLEACLGGLHREVVRPKGDGLRTMASIIALVVLLIMLGAPLSLEQSAILVIVGTLAGYAVMVHRGFIVDMGSAVVHRWNGLLGLWGLSGALVIVGSMWLGDRIAGVGLIGLLLATAAAIGRYAALWRMAISAEATLVAQALVLGERSCPNCGVVMDPAIRSCPACGADAGRFCTSCGLSVLGRDRFCSSCGTLIAPPLPDPLPGQIAQRFCITCGSPIGMATLFCDRCSMEEPAPCPLCGTALFPADGACSLCGLHPDEVDGATVRSIVAASTPAVVTE
ncbi:MAG: hypothetical protein GWP04_04585 [Gammaproteobacteria bacterium]|nr:hypothetical protein [Gammaproteobacteria bacterium]